MTAENITQQIAAAFPRRLDASPHEIASQHHLTTRLATLLGLEFIPDYDPIHRHRVSSVYYVPMCTLIDGAAKGSAEERLDDIHSHADLFGGVVPYPFVATKAITHPLIDRNADTPPGWSAQFSQKVRQAVLRGTSAFSRKDALRAGVALLRNGPVRIKPALATAGRGQRLVENRAELEAALEEQDAAAIAACGVVLEEHLDDVRTYSIGQVCVKDLICSYVGTQSLTPDNSGAMVYGGSKLFFARGGYDALLAFDLSDSERLAVHLSRIYDAAAFNCYPGLYASRRNYDVAQGNDAKGQVRTGVLEQSWRAGGASLAEAYAVEAFLADPGTASLSAFTCERYGAAHPPPPADQLVYRGNDTKVGFITKYSGILEYGDT